MKIIYSFNKAGYEAEQWTREIAAASDEHVVFIPFNHGAFVNPNAYLDSVQLDQRYQRRDPALLRLHAALLEVLRANDADVLFVTNAPPYHPDFLRTVRAHKVLYSTDDPGATYMRTIPYVHAYDQLMYCAPTYSADMDLGEKLRYAGARRVDWLPLGVFDFEFDTSLNETAILNEERDIDVIYVGSFFRQKMEFLARLKKRLGKRLRMHGFFRAKHNLWWNVKFGAPGWIRPIGFEERVRLYRRAKVGFNLHWNEFGLGNQRLYHLSANAVAQICDCADHVSRIYQPGSEIDTYRSSDELLQKIEHYLRHDSERRRLAANAYRRTMAEYRIGTVARRTAHLIAQARNASVS